MPHASTSSGTAPSDEIASTTRVASPTARFRACTSATIPVEVSECVQKTTPAPLSATAAPTSSGAGTSPHSNAIRCTSSPYCSQIATQRSPNAPALTTATRSPGAQRFAAAESIAPVPEAANSSTSSSVRCTSLSRARQRS